MKKGFLGLILWCLCGLMAPAQTIYRLDGNDKAVAAFWGTGASGDNLDTLKIAIGSSTITIPGSKITGAYTASAMTMSTARLLGRTTASTGVVEEITIGTGLLFSSGTISLPQAVATSSTPTFAGLTLTGPLLAPDGAVGAPAYSWSGDTDTGIYRSASNVINIAAGGTSYLQISNSGISSTAGNFTSKSVVYPLAVNLSDGSNGGLRANGFTGEGSDLGFYAYANGTQLASFSSSGIQLINGDLYPFPDGGRGLGRTDRRWGDVYAVLGNFSGVLTITTAAPGTNTTQAASTAFVTAAIAAAGGGAYLDKSGTYTAAAGEKILANTSSAAFTITIPASPTTGQSVEIVDGRNTFDTNNLTIDPGSNKIESTSGTQALNVEGARIIYVWSGDATIGWRVLQ